MKIIALTESAISLLPGLALSARKNIRTLLDEEPYMNEERRWSAGPFEASSLRFFASSEPPSKDVSSLRSSFKEGTDAGRLGGICLLE